MNKNHIINEIIRTTKENNGIPLGRRRFENETGVKYADWFGKHWTKWGDAVKEAGFKPNKMQSAYDENWLTEQVILLIRELKNFPTAGDFRMKSFNTDNFLNHKTIQRGLGRKHELVQKIINYCKGKPECRDIIEICNKVQDTFKNKDDYISKEADIQFGYVYLMKSGQYYKIGRSSYVEKRNYELGIKLPEELKIIHKIKTDDPNGIEAYWHKRFEEKRKKGEGIFWTFATFKGDLVAFLLP